MLFLTRSDLSSVRITQYLEDKDIFRRLFIYLFVSFIFTVIWIKNTIVHWHNFINFLNYFFLCTHDYPQIFDIFLTIQKYDLNILRFVQGGLFLFTKDLPQNVWNEEIIILDLSYFYLGLSHLYLPILILFITSIYFSWYRDWKSYNFIYVWALCRKKEK